MEARSRTAERSEETRAALIAAARELFSEHGYAAVGTEQIVRQARVTRGALYHHFTDKRDLFRAVHEAVEGDMVAAVTTAMAGIEDPIELLLAGSAAFLDLCTDPGWTRIPLLEAPAVLGWQEWREIDQRHALGLITAGLEAAMAGGTAARQPVRPLAHLLLASLGEAGLMIATAPDPAAARAEVEPTLVGLLESLRV